MGKKENNLYWHKHSVSAEDRWESNGYKSCVLWMTGLSASGKSTLANAVNKRLHVMGINSYVLDGDNIRHGLNEEPDSPEIVLETHKMTVDECIDRVLDYLIDNKFIYFLKRPRGVFVK